jgi:hypothetical protein
MNDLNFNDCASYNDCGNQSALITGSGFSPIYVSGYCSDPTYLNQSDCEFFPIPMMNTWTPAIPFSGNFDGNRKKIIDLFINVDGTIGLFGEVSGSINDLGLIDVNLNSDTESSFGSYVGSGALVGKLNYLGSVNRCYATGNSYVYGQLIGGLVGYVENSFIIDSYSTVNLQPTGGDGYSVGGLVGGYVCNWDGNINNSYSTGLVQGTDSVGGLFGQVYDASPKGTNNFWDMNTSGKTNSSGWGVSFGTGKTTTEMKTKSTFTVSTS